MALVTSTSGPKYARYAGAVVSAPPFTVSLWCYPLNTTEDHYIWALSNATLTRNHALALYGSFTGFGTDNVAAISDDGSVPAGNAISTASFVANSWQHICGVWASTSDRRVYLNGGSKGTDTLTRAPTVDRTLDGAVLAGGVAYGSSCRLAMRAVWNVALTDAEVATLAAGFHPLLVRPASLVSLCPFGGFHGDRPNDIVGGYTPTAINSPTYADGPRIIYPQGPLDVQLAASSPPVAAFSATPLSGTAPLSVAFTDASTNTPTSWLWERSSDAGSSWATFSTSQNPTAAFTAGTWAVRLTATNAGGSDEETKLAYITVSAAASGQAGRLLLGLG